MVTRDKMTCGSNHRRKEWSYVKWNEMKGRQSKRKSVRETEATEMREGRVNGWNAQGGEGRMDGRARVR